jgi:hypothetical protein
MEYTLQKWECWHCSPKGKLDPCVLQIWAEPVMSVPSKCPFDLPGVDWKETESKKEIKEPA